MHSKWIGFLLTFILLSGCTESSAASTRVPSTPVVVTGTISIPTTHPTSKEPAPIPTPDVAVGASFIGTFQGEEAMIIHVSTGVVEFYPEALEVLDSSTKQVLAGPFPLSKNGSGLCQGTYDSENLNASKLPAEFQDKVSTPPYYTFRVIGHGPSGEKAISEFLTSAQFTCANTTKPIVVGLGQVEFESSQKESEVYFHVNVLDKNEDFIPATIEIIDPSINQAVGGPFQVTQKDSGLCSGVGYETENIGSLLVGIRTLRPEYIYRVKLSNAAGKHVTLDTSIDSDVCRTVLR